MKAMKLPLEYRVQELEKEVKEIKKIIKEVNDKRSEKKIFCPQNYKGWHDCPRDKEDKCRICPY